MEHRHSARTAVDIKMLLYRRGLPVATGWIRNASRGGVFLETAYPELRLHQHIEFEFRIDGDCSGRRHRIAAHVLRRAGDGVALEIDEGDHAASVSMGMLAAGRGGKSEGLRSPSASAA